VLSALYYCSNEHEKHVLLRFFQRIQRKNRISIYFVSLQTSTKPALGVKISHGLV